MMTRFPLAISAFVILCLICMAQAPVGTVTQDPVTGVVTANASMIGLPKVQCVIKPNKFPGAANLYITCNVGAGQYGTFNIGKPYISAGTISVNSPATATSSGGNSVTMIFRALPIVPPGTTGQLIWEIAANGSLFNGTF
jgi:hypothetical protein